MNQKNPLPVPAVYPSDCGPAQKRWSAFLPHFLVSAPHQGDYTDHPCSLRLQGASHYSLAVGLVLADWAVQNRTVADHSAVSIVEVETGIVDRSLLAEVGRRIVKEEARCIRIGFAGVDGRRSVVEGDGTLRLRGGLRSRGGLL